MFSTGVEFVIPDVFCLRSFVEVRHNSLHASALKGARQAVQYRMQVAHLQQQLAKAYGSILRDTSEGLLDNNTSASTGFQGLLKS